MALYAGRLQLTNWTDGLIGQASLERSILNQKATVRALVEKVRGKLLNWTDSTGNSGKGLHKQNVRLALAQQSGQCASRRLAPVAVGI
ncbi:hypothetical protein T4B_13557 [Trichinella pseudospiralis]|uniref:Uncharacterized protein n=1 Tax=Trichinella pseudospiralis TaxID=6337 RepID=A0A0V0YBG1_TRIPS|nr:hypothetical protein T4E_11997 [Trichinella pseudospiralis]KRY78984.1 hypothetical protein T4A_14428 [Trichinella pseudospiralis]KRZ32973.1 hypothetical protein T4B_13557 [Trichinella pseudospiralis]KRZ45844.1 hypothetical protein T4C_7444 [Trichinella pseudospiralis]